MSALAALSEDVANLAERGAAHVVGIHGRSRGGSSGFAWGPGVVVTAEETLQRDDDLAVVLPDGRKVSAELAGRDPSTAIAVLKIAEDLPPTPREDAAALKPGHLVVSVGRREGAPIAALGMAAVASGPWRSRRGGEIDRLIRLDLSLDWHAEGGPVFDALGRAVGMAVFGPRRRALVIPNATIERVAGQLLSRGRIARGYLGLGLRSVRLESGQGEGVIVVSVDPYGPGRRAGMLVGDVIIGWDGAPVVSAREAMTRLGGESVGRTARLNIIRAGAPVEAALTIGERPEA